MVPEVKNDLDAQTPADVSTEEKEHRIFINDRGEGTFICPACKKGVIRDLNQFSQFQTAVRLKCKCSCGNDYRVLLERRRHFRKSVNLVGMFLFQGGSGNPIKGLIKIRNISQSGIQFSVNSMPEFKVGDKLTIEFTLDDEEHSQVHETGIVQRIQSNIVGLDFETTDHYGRLGRYLFQ
ncbi:PilZ domain-containing protein [Desulfosarcina sp.]|uniref:PilZ domain-containing protein n=1 Tax=Desulfosarcina sp. TaxID=2027861 RepID=UPI003567B602